MSLPLLTNISSSATEIEVGSAITNVSGGGIIQIESEFVGFSSADSSRFYGCTRGVAGSTAVAHIKDKGVTLIGLVADPVQSTVGSYVTETYADRHSHQSVAADLTLDPNAGTSDGSNPKFVAASMFNLFGASLLKTANYLAGVIGAFSVTGVQLTTYVAAAVVGLISDGVTEADGAFVAIIDGDSSVTTAGAAYTVRNNNSNGGSGFAFGVDLKGAAHDGFPAVAYRTGEIRFSNGTKVTVSGDTIVFTNAAATKSFTITMV